MTTTEKKREFYGAMRKAYDEKRAEEGAQATRVNQPDPTGVPVTGKLRAMLDRLWPWKR